MRILLFFLSVLGVARAAGPETAPRQVNLEFTLFAWGGNTPELAFKPAGMPPRILKAAAFERSQVVKYQGPAEVVLSAVPKKKTDGPESSTPTPEADAKSKGVSVTFPENTGRATLLVITQPDGHFSILAVPEDGGEFAADHARILNFTKIPVGLNLNRIDNERLAGGASLMTPSLRGRLLLQAAIVKEGQWIKVLDTVIKIAPGERKSVILCPGDTAFFKRYRSDGTVSFDNILEAFVLPPWPEKPTNS